MTTIGTMALPERNESADGTIRVEYKDSNHTYKVSCRAVQADGFLTDWTEPVHVPSVSGVIGAYDKPALVGAAAKVTLEGVATLANVKGVTVQNFRNVWKLDTALRERNLRHWQVWGRAADRGTFVHAVLQAWIEDGRTPTTDDVPEDYQPYVAAFGAFVTAHQPESITSEVIVASAKHGYAGRYDWTARLTKECEVPDCGCHYVGAEPTEYGWREGGTVRIDFKSSKALYPENMAQLDLYEVAAVEMGEDQADYRAPLRLGKDGTYEFQVSRLPYGGALGLVEGYKARQTVNQLHEFLNPRKGRKRG